MSKPTLRALTTGGPGHDGYAYQADVLCVTCGEAVLHAMAEEGTLPRSWDDAGDTEQCPVPVFFGESDCPQHCGVCQEYLYGPQQRWADGTWHDEPDDDGPPLCPECGELLSDDGVCNWCSGNP